MSLLESQITGHVGKSQDLNVDTDIVDGLKQAADYCRDIQEIKIYMGGKGLDDFNETGEKLVDKAKKLQKQPLDALNQ
ncbi:hypothetical protein [Natronorubrum sp. FCH18a]|uniref:hypothetical protein n=1 Tax=Natronorubrum sp. FCH18a TaxID=3447018 RepID=UPI003F5189B5